MSSGPPAPEGGRVPPGGLRAGDVLLMRGAGEFSTLVAWLGESRYSHAAVMVGKGGLIEAITDGVVETSLDELLELGSVERVDAYRPSMRDGTAFTAADRSAVAVQARSYLGTPFVVAGLVMLGMVAAVRDRVVIADPRLRFVVRRALRQLAQVGDRGLICSELVYLSLRECDVHPPGRLRPVILERVPDPMPMPPIDVPELLRELWKMFGPDTLLPVSLQQPGAEPTASQAELDRVHIEVRALLGLLPPSSPSPWRQVTDIGAVPRENPVPEPRWVRPREFELSPSLGLLGRLK